MLCTRALSGLAALVLALSMTALGQDSDSQNKNFDIRSSVGDLHVGNDADAKQAGLPLYPGAWLKGDQQNNDRANLSVFTEAFGLKLVVAKYESDDTPAQVIDFYRNRLKKYGKVLECHSQKSAGDVDVHDQKDDGKNSEADRPVKCDENDGPVVELKVGTENNQHIVAVQSGESGKGSTFALVYVHMRGKQGEI
jgi:hypothetical protein